MEEPPLHAASGPGSAAFAAPKRGAGSSIAPIDRAPDGEPTRTPTSERLLATAAKLFWTNGYASTTTREIAELLGVRKASLYHHIARKEDLLFEISVSSLEHITRGVTAAVEAIDDPVERVRTLICGHVSSMIADQEKHSVMLTELRALSPGRRATIVAMRDDYERVVSGVLEGARAAGALRSDVPTKYLTLSLLNLLNWSIFWFQPQGGLSPEGLAGYLATLYLSGAAKAAEGADLGPGSPALPGRP